MPITGFICPDGGTIDIQNCLNHDGCRLKKRCMSRATLAQISSQRPYTREKLITGEQSPSTTQLLNGTMEEYLKITKPYAIVPQKRAFAVFGTRVHGVLDKKIDNDSLGDSDLRGLTSSMGVSGLPDLVETEFGITTLTDYKTTSYYKVKKALEGEVEDWSLQLNHYRFIMEEQGFKIDNLQIQVFIRDWSDRYAATCPTPIMCLPIKKICDDNVRDYFKTKKQKLIDMLNSDEPANFDVCNDHERWGGRKCEKYCDVKGFCPIGKCSINKKGG